MPVPCRYRVRPGSSSRHLRAAREDARSTSGCTFRLCQQWGQEYSRRGEGGTPELFWNPGPKSFSFPVLLVQKHAETVHSEQDCHPQACQGVPREAAGVSFPLTLLLHQFTPPIKQPNNSEAAMWHRVLWLWLKITPKPGEKQLQGLCTLPSPAVGCVKGSQPWLAPFGGQPDPPAGFEAGMLLCSSAWGCHCWGTAGRGRRAPDQEPGASLSIRGKHSEVGSWPEPAFWTCGWWLCKPGNMD